MKNIRYDFSLLRCFYTLRGKLYSKSSVRFSHLGVGFLKALQKIIIGYQAAFTNIDFL